MQAGFGGVPDDLDLTPHNVPQRTDAARAL
jgi:hypothetical protein